MTEANMLDPEAYWIIALSIVATNGLTAKDAAKAHTKSPNKSVDKEALCVLTKMTLLMSCFRDNFGRIAGVENDRSSAPLSAIRAMDIDRRYKAII